MLRQDGACFKNQILAKPYVRSEKWIAMLNPKLMSTVATVAGEEMISVENAQVLRVLYCAWWVNQLSPVAIR